MPEKKPKIGELSEAELAAVAKKEVNEDPRNKEADLKAIKEWIKKQPHLKKARTDEKFILPFLRGCKYSLERTKEKIDTFYSCKSACPEWFDNWDNKDEKILQLLHKGTYVPLNGFDKNGRSVMIMRPGVFDPAHYSIDNQLKLSFMISMIMMERMDQSTVTGFVGIQEMDNLGMGHAMQFTPSMGKKAMTIWQDAFPQRPKGMHFLNMPGVMESIFGIMSSFAKDKMKDRLHVHKRGDLSQLIEMVGTDVLPKEYGGTNGTIQDHVDIFIEEFDSRKKWLGEQSKYKSDESKRKGKPKGHSELFGIEGSFRQLAFD